MHSICFKRERRRITLGIPVLASLSHSQDSERLLPTRTFPVRAWPLFGHSIGRAAWHACRARCLPRHRRRHGFKLFPQSHCRQLLYLPSPLIFGKIRIVPQILLHTNYNSVLKIIFTIFLVQWYNLFFYSGGVCVCTQKWNAFKALSGETPWALTMSNHF